jgi:hypothetical protein
VPLSNSGVCETAISISRGSSVGKAGIWSLANTVSHVSGLYFFTLFLTVALEGVFFDTFFIVVNFFTF